MKRLVGLWVHLLSACIPVFSQVDTTFIYNPSMPYGTLDLRIAKSDTRYYYLQEDTTFSHRESSPGVKSHTFRDMTAWNSNPYRQGNLRERNGAQDLFIMNYRFLMPTNYNSAYDPGYPIIIMLHGLGERGNCWDNKCYWNSTSWSPNTNSPPAPATATHNLLNNDHNLLHGGLKHLTAVNLAGSKLPDDPTLLPTAFPGFVLFPQNLNGWGNVKTVEDAIRILRLVIKKYNIDENRVYIHGLSNGGGAVYQAVKRAPWLFAAVLPMSAINDGGIINDGLAAEVGKLPVWVFQGGQDRNPSPSRTYNTIKNLREAGAVVRYYLYHHLGHGTWNTAYNEPDFFSWILQKRKYNPHIFYGNPVICNTTGAGVRLGFSNGFAAYQWEHDGEIATGATTSEYVANTPGTYRGRFSRKLSPSEVDWEPWSDPIVVTEINPAKPVIHAVGSTHLRGPGLTSKDANNNVILKSVDQADLYTWFKNEVPIDFSATDVDDTLRLAIFTTTNTSNNGEYTLRTSYSYCPSPASDPVTLFFNNSATQNIALNPTEVDFKGSVISSGIFLTWNDRTSNESGYEIWRRKLGTADFKFATRTPKNAISFYDGPLEPSTTYEYKLRAVSSTGASNYIPSNDLAVNYQITTAGDNLPPSPPQQLTMIHNTITSVTLSWKAAVDNTGISQYIIDYGGNTIYTDTSTTSYTINNLTPNTTFPVSARAVDFAGHVSSPSNQIIGTTYVLGLFYKHSTGAWEDLDDSTLTATWINPEFTGFISNFSLAPRTQEDFFNFQYTGYLDVITPGDYIFRTTSNDGSRLILEDSVIVENDGLHGNTTITSDTLHLTTGPHAIEVQYFDYAGSQSLTVQYQGPDIGPAFKNIPDSLLRSGKYNAATPPSPPMDLAAQGIAMQQINLTWQTSGTQEVELYRSSTADGTYPIIARTSATSFADTTALLPGTAYFYKARAIASDGLSVFTSTVSASTLTDTTPPTTPTALLPGNKSHTHITFTWTSSTDNVGVTAYEVYANGVLKGTAPIGAFTVSALLANTVYDLRVKAVDASGNKSTLSDGLTITTDPAGIFYSLPTGDLHELSTWKQNINGTGNSPASFADEGQYFIISNRTQATLSGNWEVPGSASKIVLSSGVTLTLDSAFAGNLEIEGTATLNINHPVFPELQAISTSSTIHFNGASDIPKKTYGNLSLGGSGIKAFAADTTTISGNLTVADGILLKGAPENKTLVILAGNLVINGSPGNTAADNRIDLQFTESHSHTLSTGGNLYFYRITTGAGATVNVVNSALPVTLRLGSLNGGGLKLLAGSYLNVEANSIELAHASAINPNNETGSIGINGGNLSLSSSSEASSYLYFNPSNNLADTLEVNRTGAGNATIGSALMISGVVKVKNGVLNAGGYVTLLSSATQTASIAEIENAGSISGSIKVQHYLEPLGESWRELATAVSGVAVSNWQNYFPVSGTFTGSSGADAPSMYISTGTGMTPYPPSGGSSNAPIERGKGYSTKLTNTSPIVLETTGNPYQGNIQFALVSGTGQNDGWNLLGNPYAAPIEWNNNSEAWISSGVSKAVVVKENKSVNGETVGQYLYYDPLLGKGVIQAGQAFWIQAFGSPSLTVTEKAKAQTVSNYPPSDSVSYLSVTLRQGLKADNAYVIFTEGGIDGLDNFDARKRSNEGMFNLSTIAAGADLAINNVSKDFCTKAVSLNLQNTAPGSYSLEFANIASLTGIGSIKLTDHLTTTTTDVSSTPYNFSVTTEASTFGPGRFTLIFERQALDIVTPQVTAESICGDEEAIIAVQPSQPGVGYVALNDNDEVVSETVEGNDGLITLELFPNVLLPGTNHLRLRAGFMGCSAQILTSEVNVHYTPAFTITTQEDITVCAGDQAMLQASGVPSGGYYRWYDENDVEIDSVQGAQLVTLPLFNETVIHVKGVNSSGCESDQKTIHLYPSTLEQPMVAVYNDTLFTQVEAFYQWKKNGVIIDGATGPYYIPPGPGAYSVLATLGGCIKESAPFDFVSSSVCQFDTVTPVASAGSNCGSDATTIFISNTQTEVRYTAIDDTGVEASEAVLGNGETISLPLMPGQLIPGANHFRFRVSLEGCENSMLTNELTLQYTPGFSVTTDEEIQLCAGDGVDLEASGAPAGGHYKWFDETETIIDGVSGAIFTVAEVGDDTIYYVSAISASGCESARKTIHIHVIDLQTPAVVVENNSLVTDAIGTYQWKNGGVDIAGATNASYHPAASGIYSVLVTHQGCSKESAPFEFTLTSLESGAGAEFVLSAYPVPSRALDFHLRVQSPKQDRVLIRIMDITGKAAFEKWYPYSEIETGVEIRPATGPLTDGVYIVIARQGILERRRRVVIMD